MSDFSVGSVSKPANLRTVVIVCYALFLFACLNGMTALVGVIIAYVKKPDAAGTRWVSHFENLIIVFWATLLVGIIGWLTLPMLIGFLILPILVVWYLWRLIRGLLRASDDRPY